MRRSVHLGGKKRGGETLLDALEAGRTGLVREACREISRDHPLYGKTPAAFTKRAANDDALLAADGAYAVIRLTWSRHNWEGCPFFLLFGHIQETLSHLGRRYIGGYLQWDAVK